MFKSEGKKYRALGLSPLPLKPGMKRPILKEWQHYCQNRVPDNVMEQWEDEYGECNIGLALGTVAASGMALIAVDVDDDELIAPVERAIGPYPCGKRGKKGMTIFVMADPTITNTKFKRMVDGTPSARPSVEILANGSQTVLPPSIHPDTKKPYTWIGTPLYDCKSKSLPNFSRGTLDEIGAICHGKDEHFVNINTMTWAGVDGGGNTHDTCLAAVAFMVARGWEDADIHCRIERAKKEACERAGEEYDWPQASHVIQGWIDSAREKGMTGNAQGRKLVPPERKMATWLLEKLGGPELVAGVDGKIRAYREGHWPEVDLEEAKREIFLADDFIKDFEAKNAISIVGTLTDRRNFGETVGVLPRDDPKRQRICLKNGTMNVRTSTLERHDPEHELCHQLPFEWDDKAKCPTYERVLEQTFNGDQDAINLWDEYCAHTLVDDMSFQKLLFLKGPGGNGKGTLARVLRNMHAPSAVSSVGVTDLNDERKRTSLVGKLINISGEQSRLNLVSDTYLKKITGGDPVDVRKLYGETKNNVLLSVRFLELVNDMPSTSDNSDALRRRIIILDCPNKVTKPDVDLDRKLLVERPGILMRWIEALKRLYERESFLMPESALKAVDEYMMENDPVAYWMEDRCEPTPDGAIGTPTRDLYCDYAEWSQALGFKNAYSEMFWGKKLTGKGYPTKNERVGKIQVRTRPIRIKEGYAR